MGWLQRRRTRRNCSHLRQRGIYGDEINFRRGSRAQCLDCGTFLPDLPNEVRMMPDVLADALDDLDEEAGGSMFNALARPPTT